MDTSAPHIPLDRSFSLACLLVGLFRLTFDSVVLQYDSAVPIDVGPGVFDFACALEHFGNDLVHQRDELDHGVVGHVLLGEFSAEPRKRGDGGEEKRRRE